MKYHQIINFEYGKRGMKRINVSKLQELSFFLSSSFSFYFHLWIVILHFSWESKEHFA